MTQRRANCASRCAPASGRSGRPWKSPKSPKSPPTKAARVGPWIGKRREPSSPIRAGSKLVILSFCLLVLGLGVGSLDGFAHVVAGGGALVLRAGGASGAGPGGFRRAGGNGQV